MDFRRRSLLALLAAAGAGCLGGPSDGGGGPTTMDEHTTTQGTRTQETPPEDGDSLAALVGANTEFALALHRQLVAESPDENLFASPFSISAALAMTWAGAEGETETAMAEALRFSLDQGTLHPAFETLIDAVEPAEGGETVTTTGGDDTTPGGGETTDDGTTTDESEPGFQLRVANALWGQEGFPFDGSFRETLADHYDAGLRKVDFQADPSAARETINGWVAEETEGKIADLLPEGVVGALTRLVVTNAIYFEATWANTFEPGATADRTFTNLDGSTAEVPTMTQTETFPYAEVDGVRAIELPYVDGEASMVVLVPPEGSFESFEADLDRETLAGLVDALERTPGTVGLPKFTFRSALRLKAALSALGMGVAFDPGEANFDGMVADDASAPDLYVEDAIHESYVAVDEEGTEAAAATGVAVGVTSAIQPQFELIVDRPFLFFIRHRETDAVLFAGRVIDGEAAQE